MCRWWSCEGAPEGCNENQQNLQCSNRECSSNAYHVRLVQRSVCYLWRGPLFQGSPESWLYALCFNSPHAAPNLLLDAHVDMLGCRMIYSGAFSRSVMETLIQTHTLPQWQFRVSHRSVIGYNNRGINADARVVRDEYIILHSYCGLRLWNTYGFITYWGYRYLFCV